MPDVLVLCPTHDHADTLFMSIASLRAQTFEDWQCVVICDGAPPRTEKVLDGIQSLDDRISYQVHPKGDRLGEAYRDPVIRASNAEFVCQIGDDDLWATNHLDSLIKLLDHGDWINQAPLRMDFEGSLEWYIVNHGTPMMRNRPHEYRGISAGPNYVAYRRASYLALPEGWTPAPKTGPSDQFMWAKFMAQSNIPVASTAATTAIKLQSLAKRRRDFSPEQRTAELGPWLAKMSNPSLFPSLRRKASIYTRMAQLFSLHRCENMASLDEAFAACGLSVGDEDMTFNAAVNGEPMNVPMTPSQKNDAELGFAFLRAFAGPVEGSSAFKDRCVELANLNVSQWRRGILNLFPIHKAASSNAIKLFLDHTGQTEAALKLQAMIDR